MKAKLIVCAMCASVAGIIHAETFDASGFAKSLDIVVLSSSLAQGVTLTGFPALVRLSTSISGFSYSDFTDQAAGSDLAFVDSDGNLIPHEVDIWDATGESLVWVKIPSFANGMVIYAYWGRSEVSGVEQKYAWSAFKGVWHMNENGSTVEPDVSGNGLNATPTSNSIENNETIDTTDRMKSSATAIVRGLTLLRGCIVATRRTITQKSTIT